MCFFVLCKRHWRCDLGNFQHTITRAIAPESAQLLNNSALQMLQDLLHTQKRPSVYAKRDLLYTQKRPIVYAKETYHIRKRDLLYTQKRPIIYAKETYCIRNSALQPCRDAVGASR